MAQLHSRAVQQGPGLPRIANRAIEILERSEPEDDGPTAEAVQEGRVGRADDDVVSHW